MSAATERPAAEREREPSGDVDVHPGQPDLAPIIDPAALRARLDAACAEGIGANVDRWLAFAGIARGDVVELVVLDAPTRGGYEATYVARGTSSASIKQLLNPRNAPRNAPGLYTLVNRPLPEIGDLDGGVDVWFPAKKGARVSDRHITHATAIYLDVDPVRPGNLKISATLAEREAAWSRSMDVLARLLSCGVPADAIGVGDSGNGTALYVALARLDECEALHAARETIGEALDALHGDDAVKIDQTVANAARLHPAYGTMKRKGAGRGERLHRPTGFVWLAPDVASLDAARLRTLADVEALASTLAQLAGIDGGAGSASTKVAGANGKANARGNGKSKSKPSTKPNARYEAVKAACTIEAVVEHLGVEREGASYLCTGCRRVTASTYENGAKCFHQTCGALYQSVIDYWASVRGIEPSEALVEMEQWQDIEPPKPKKPSDRIVRVREATASPTATATTSIGEVESPTLAQLLTEVDVSRYFAHKHAADLRYAHGIGWLVWDGRVWARDRGEVTRELVKGCAADLRNYAAQTGNDETWKLAQSVGRARAVGAILDAARSDPRLRIDPAEIDAKPHLLAVENGVIDLRTGELRPHDRADLLTRMAPSVYDPDARSDELDRVLEHLVPDVDARAYLQRCVGYSLYGTTTEDVVILLVGPPRCGKGTFLRAVKSTLGEHYAEPAAESFCKPHRADPPDKPRSDLVGLVGRRVAVVPEGITGAKLDAALVKRLAGGDKLTVRDLGKPIFSTDVSFTLWMVANDGEVPKLEASDGALWERIRRIPIGSTVAEGERDPALRERMGSPEVRSAMLAWGVLGAVEWHRSGLGPQPDSVRAASADLRAEHDPLGQCIGDLLVFEPDATTAKAAVREAVAAWFESEGDRAPSPKRLGAALRAAGVSEGVEVSATTARIDGRVTHAWRGVRLMSEAERLECSHVATCSGQSAERFPTRARGGSLGTQVATSGYVATADDDDFASGDDDDEEWFPPPAADLARGRF